MPSDTDPTQPTGTHEPIWFDTSSETDYPALDGDRVVDTAVVGGGIAGLSTAERLVDAGQSVAVLERDRIVRGVTGHTTAKLTSLHGLIYDHLLDRFGERLAHQYAEANEAAIDHVESTADRLDTDPDVERRPAYTYVPPGEDDGQIHDEVAAARQLGLPATRVRQTELPYEVGAAVRFDDQASFHPRRYLLGLAREIDEDGGSIYEHTTVTDVRGGSPAQVRTDAGTVTADHVVVATHFPIADHALYFARMSPKRSYVVAARLTEDPPEGMYYDPTEPYFSVRPHPAGEDPLVLVGGQNHRTGHGHGTTERYRRLERQARERFPVETIEYRWATQDYVSVDRVPFVGKLAPHVRNVSVATGFGGWGMTNGTAAGMVLADRVLDRDDEWAQVYRPARFRPIASMGPLLSHNRHAMSHFFEDHLTSPPRLDLSRVGRGEGHVFTDRDDPVAVYRDDDGAVHAVSAACTHMGCHVSWNDGERSWDCPCHGSRFDVDGTVLDTPAVDDLDRRDVVDVDRRGGASAERRTEAPDD